MEVDSFNLDEQVVALANKRAKERLRLGEFYNLQFVRHGEEDNEDSALVRAVERAYSSYIAIVETFAQEDLFRDNADPSSKKVLTNFGFYVGSVEALAILKRLGAKTDVTIPKSIGLFGFNGCKLTDYAPSLDRLIEFQMARLRSAATHATAEDITTIFFQGLKNTAEQEVIKDRGKNGEYLSYLEGIHLAVNGIVFNGFQFYSSAQHRVHVSTSTDVKIIGNKDVLEEIDGIVNTVGLYDPHTQTNVELDGGVPLTVLLQGLPGCGKTLTIKYMAGKVARIAQEKRAKVNIVVVDNSFKDKFHGEDIKHLLGYFDEVSEPQGIGMLCIDDAESVLQARDAHDASHIEGQAINVFLSWLNGMRTNYKGNFMVVLASNYPEKLDSALTSRIQRKLTVLGPQTPEEYTAILKIGLGPMADYVNITPEEYAEIGDWCKEHKLSGRDINSASVIINGYVRNALAITPQIQALPTQKQREALHSLRRRVDKGYVQKVLQDIYQAKQDNDTAEYHRRIGALTSARRIEFEAELHYRQGMIVESLRDEKPEVVRAVLDVYRADYVNNARRQFLPEEQLKRYIEHAKCR